MMQHFQLQKAQHNKNDRNVTTYIIPGHIAESCMTDVAGIMDPVGEDTDALLDVGDWWQSARILEAHQRHLCFVTQFCPLPDVWHGRFKRVIDSLHANHLHAHVVT